MGKPKAFNVGGAVFTGLTSIGFAVAGQQWWMGAQALACAAFVFAVLTDEGDES